MGSIGSVRGVTAGPLATYTQRFDAFRQAPVHQASPYRMGPVADALHMTEAELERALASGRTLDDLAKERGVAHASLIGAIKQGIAMAARGHGAGPVMAGVLLMPETDRMAETIAHQRRVPKK